MDTKAPTAISACSFLDRFIVYRFFPLVHVPLPGDQGVHWFLRHDPGHSGRLGSDHIGWSRLGSCETAEGAPHF